MATLHKFVLHGQGPNGINWRSIYYYSSVASFTPTSTQMQAWSTALAAVMLPLMAGTWSWNAVGYAPYTGGAPETDPKGWGAELVYPSSKVGSASGESLPGQSAYVVLGRTATKHVFAKKFIPGIVEGAQNGGVYDGATTTLLNNFGGFLYASTYDMGGTALTPGAWGPRHGFTPTVSFSLSYYIGSQRRRKPGVGL